MLRLSAVVGSHWRPEALMECLLVHCLLDSDYTVCLAYLGCKGNWTASPITVGRMGGHRESNYGLGDPVLIRAIPEGSTEGRLVGKSGAKINKPGPAG